MHTNTYLGQRQRKSPPEKESFFLCTLPGLYNSPFRRSRSTEAPGPYSRGEYGSGGSPQPPLCKGGTDCQRQSGGIVKLDKPTQLGSIIQRGSAVWPSGPPDRRSPTAPFAQGSRLCCPAYNQPPPVDNKKLPRWGSFFAFISVLSSSAEAQFGCPDTGPAQKKSLCPR